MLAAALLTRFKGPGDHIDLENGIIGHQDALALRPPSHPDRPHSLINITYSLLTRFDLSGVVIT